MGAGADEVRAASARSSSDCLACWQPSGVTVVRSGLAHPDLASELAESSGSGFFDAHQGLPRTVGLLEVAACRRCSGWEPSSSTATDLGRHCPDYPGCTRLRRARCSSRSPRRAVVTAAERAAGCLEEQSSGHPSSFSSSGRDVDASGTSIGPSSPISSP